MNSIATRISFPMKRAMMQPFKKIKSFSTDQSRVYLAQHVACLNLSKMFSQKEMSHAVTRFLPDIFIYASTKNITSVEFYTNKVVMELPSGGVEERPYWLDLRPSLQLFLKRDPFLQKVTSLIENEHSLKLLFLVTI